jgi:CRP-like cAMP-binding protein
MTIDDELKLLKKVSLFAEVEPSQLRLLAMSADHLRFEPGEIMIREGDPPEDVLIIISGEARAAPDVALRTLAGYLGVLLEKPYPVSIRAVSAVAALRLRADHFRELMLLSPEINRAVVRELGRIIEAMIETRSRESVSNPVPRRSGNGDGDGFDRD